MIKYMPNTLPEKLHPFSCTVSELCSLGKDALPMQFISGEHLIYSSPASLSFNSPGAEGFGVKRAALSIPGSVLLLVSPGCCGRNTSGIGNIGTYKDRFYFLNMDEADIVTGKHLKKIPDAVENTVLEYENRTGRRPSAVMICITCADALLGTDMERVCRRAEEQVGLPVRPSYMYALTREGRKPPMVHIRQSLYSLLEKRKKNASSINLIGNFAPLTDDCELYDIFRSMGIKKIRELSRCSDYDEFMLMSEANFNVVLNPEARPAAADMEKRLGIPYIELKRLYQLDKIENQYTALGNALGAKFDLSREKTEALGALAAFKKALSANGKERPVFAVGEFSNADPFELSLALIKEGFEVSEIFGTITAENFIYIEKLSELAPKTRVYSNLDPGMIYYSENDSVNADFVIGKDAAYYHPHAVSVLWREDIQPFGFAGIKKLYTALLSAYMRALDSEAEDIIAAPNSLNAGCTDSVSRMASDTAYAVYDGNKTDSCDYNFKKSSAYTEDCSDSCGRTLKKVRGFRSYLPPFAPDASGASSVLYSLGGIIVICDAGGCAGNICGFDEPRWLTERSAVYSAGLRDMDAILGRDDRLVEKLKRTAESVGGVPFAAIIGTPVPAVIATDWHALKSMSERRTGIKTLGIDTSGMELYDVGASKAYTELFCEFAVSADELNKDGAGNAYDGYTGILGATPLDISAVSIKEFFAGVLNDKNICCFGMGDGTDAVRSAAVLKKNIVVAPSGIKAAQYLERKFGIPYETAFPGADIVLKNALLASGLINAHIADSRCTESAFGTDNGSASRSDELTDGGKHGCDGFGICGKALEDSMASLFAGKRVLIIHQDILADAIALEIGRLGCNADITAACWFKTVHDAAVRLHDESDLRELAGRLRPDIIIGDISMKPLCESTGIRPLFIDLPHFAVSGRLSEGFYKKVAD